MVKIIEGGGLKVDERLVHLVQDEIAPGTGVDPSAFWTSLGRIVKDLAPKNRELLENGIHCKRKLTPGTWPEKVNLSTRRSIGNF